MIVWLGVWICPTFQPYDSDCWDYLFLIFPWDIKIWFFSRLSRDPELTLTITSVLRLTVSTQCVKTGNLWFLKVRWCLVSTQRLWAVTSVLRLTVSITSVLRIRGFLSSYTDTLPFCCLVSYCYCNALWVWKPKFKRKSVSLFLVISHLSLFFRVKLKVCVQK